MFDPLIGVRWSFGGDEAPPSEPNWQREMAEHAARCAARHLVVAAVELARDPDIPRDRAARFSLAEAKFRALTDCDGINLGRAVAATVPSVALPGGLMVPMIDLLVEACQLHRFRLPLRSIDSELVYAAKELLSGLVWQFPEEPAAGVPGLPIPTSASRLSPSKDPV